MRSAPCRWASSSCIRLQPAAPSVYPRGMILHQLLRRRSTTVSTPAEGASKRRMVSLRTVTGLLALGLGLAVLVDVFGLDASERPLPGPGWLVGWANSDDTRFAVHAAFGKAL